MNLPDGNAGGFPAVDALDQPHSTDAAVATVSAITNLIPIVGGALAASLSEWRLHVATNRLVAALEEIRRAIEAVQDDVDRHFAASPEFQKAVDWTVESATQARNTDKRRFYASALARTATFHRPREPEREIMLDTLDQLRPVHLAILAAVAADPSPPTEAEAYLDGRSAPHRRLIEAVPGIPLDVLSKCWEDLAGLQLLAPIGVLTVDYGLARPAGAAEPPIVTPFGQRFLAFVTLPIVGE